MIKCEEENKDKRIKRIKTATDPTQIENDSTRKRKGGREETMTKERGGEREGGGREVDEEALCHNKVEASITQIFTWGGSKEEGESERGREMCRLRK